MKCNSRKETVKLESKARTPCRMKVAVTITPSAFDYPRSCIANYERPAPVVPEEDVLGIVKRYWRSLPDNEPLAERTKPRRETITVDLFDFEIYRCPEEVRASELTSLHLFDVKAKNLCFDGFVRVGGNKYYLERIQIQDISIGGYGSDSDPGVTAYLQTSLASRDTTSDIWLQLRRPASYYKRFHSPFLWVAGLGKHVIDYMENQPRGSIGLESFTRDFYQWLVQRFGSNNQFQAWHAAFKCKTDFGIAFNVHAEFFYKQALNLSTSSHLSSHPVWRHCMCDRQLAIPRQPDLIKYTLVTPRVYQCFKHMYFAGKLKQTSPVEAVSRMQMKRKAGLRFAEDCTVPNLSRRIESGLDASHIRVGDVVSIVPDSVDKTKWQKSDNEWLAYVQGVTSTASGVQRLLVLWLYRASDTNICHAKYPIENELFLSDNCNCKERGILSTDVVRKATVAWSPRPLNTDREFIIRQTYITCDSAFVTVNEAHKTCPCRRPKPSTNWSPGDTVYVSKTTDSQQLLEPVVIHEVDYETRQVKVRTLLRLARDCPSLAQELNRKDMAPNELVLTGKVKTVPLSRIQRACHIRFISHADVLRSRIPAPYNLRGAGDHWFISLGLESAGNVERLVILQKLPTGFHEAQQAPAVMNKLRGLSLFSGGGSLDRGLEEGGAVEFETAVDYDSAAIHTQRANCLNPQKMRLYCGSVDDYLNLLLSGAKNRLVARVGEVDVIAAGSPCPGFSSLQQNKLSEQSLTYASHITTFCTAVDIYRPLYGVLENVVNMASEHKAFEDQKILSQLVASLVSMGYQVNQYIMDSWTYGSCQRRSRIILTIAAPGFAPMLQRPHTHSRSYEETAARSLGRLPNGERFGDREHYATPFSSTSARDATADLPDIGNGNVQSCIVFPDHRLSRPTNSKARALLECIPRHPPGQGYAQAVQLGLVPPLLHITKKKIGNAYKRIQGDGLIPTITTDVNMQDAYNGASVHWSQNRPPTIQEVKRTQGYGDDELIIGTLKEQWKILGNGVDRKVSFSLGLELHDALVASKHALLRSECVEDDTEIIVDVEEDAREWSSKAVENSPQSRPSVSCSFWSDSFSSMRGVQQRLGLSGSADMRDVKPQVVHREVAPLQEQRGKQCEAAKAPTPDESMLSRLSRKVTQNVGIFSLPVLPSLLQSKHPAVRSKRQREDEPDDAEHPRAVSPSTMGAVKRAKTKSTRRTTSPTGYVATGDVGVVHRRSSLPTLGRTTLTRSLGPPRYAPKAWHREIGSVDNVVELV